MNDEKLYNMISKRTDKFNRCQFIAEIMRLEKENQALHKGLNKVLEKRRKWKNKYYKERFKARQLRVIIEDTIKFCSILLNADIIDIDNIKCYKNENDDLITKQLLNMLNQYKNINFNYNSSIDLFKKLGYEKCSDHKYELKFVKSWLNEDKCFIEIWLSENDLYIEKYIVRADKPGSRESLKFDIEEFLVTYRLLEEMDYM